MDRYTCGGVLAWEKERDYGYLPPGTIFEVIGFLYEARWNDRGVVDVIMEDDEGAQIAIRRGSLSSIVECAQSARRRYIVVTLIQACAEQDRLELWAAKAEVSTQDHLTCLGVSGPPPEACDHSFVLQSMPPKCGKCGKVLGGKVRT